MISTTSRWTGRTLTTLFPLVIAAMVWGGVYLRDPRVRTLLLGQP